MSARSLSRAAGALAALLVIAVILCPAIAHASAGEPFPLRSATAANAPIPWLDEIVAELLAALVKVLQDLMKGVGILFWAALKLCGIVGLLGSDFSSLFGSVVVEAINAVVSGTIAGVIRASLTISVALLGVSLLLRIVWPDLKVVSFQRIVLWGTLIQAYLLHAPTIYTELEALRVDLAEEVAAAVSSGAVPGCSGSTVEVILCMSGTNPTEVQHPDLTVLPDSLPPYGGTETIHDLYNHCVYNPPAYYGDAGCDPDEPTGDPWQVLTYAQNALGSQTLSLILGLVILAYGVLQMALGLAAGMMFVLFPVAAIFAFFLPLESFAAGVIRNYIGIFLKSVVLLTLAAVVIRLFTVASASLISLAAVGLIALILCGIMAKEALASLLSSVSFVGSSVSSLGSTFGLTGGGGGGASGYPSPESRMAASMIGGPMAQTLMGAPNPYLHGASGGLVGAATSAPGRALGSARAAVSAAVGAGTGGLGFVAGAMAATRGADFGSLALGGQAAHILGGRDAAQGFALGASAAALRRTMAGATGAGGRQPAAPTSPAGATPAGASTPGSPSSPSPTLRRAAPASPGSGSPSGTTPGAPASTSAPAAASPQPTTPSTGAPSSPPQPPDAAGAAGGSGTAPAVAAIQAVLSAEGDPSAPEASLSAWSPAAGQRIQSAAAHLGTAPAETRQNAYDLMQASYDAAQRWQGEGRSPFLESGIVDPHFVDDVIQQAPAAARAFTVGQAKAGVPAGSGLSLADTVALGATTPAQGTTTPPASAPAAPESTTYDPALYGQLQAWRREESERQGKAAFHVFTDATLQRIAAARPQTEEELLAVKGVGPKKLASFGQAVLDVTRAQPAEGETT